MTKGFGYVRLGHTCLGLVEGNAMRLVFVAAVMVDVYDQHLRISPLLELALFRLPVLLLFAVGSFLLPDGIIGIELRVL